MGPMVRCKVKCTDVSSESTSENGKVREDVRFEAVTSGDGSAENAEWSKYTPAANFTMAITNDAAFGRFVAGQEYYVDFTPALTPAAEESPDESA